MARLIKWQGAIVGLFVAGALGCKDQSPTEPAASGPIVTALTPVNFNGTAGGVSSISPAIQITDGKTGAPLANVPVRFLLNAPLGLANRDGSVAHDSVVTDAQGIARAGEWRFDTYAGVTEVVAWVYGGARARFTATLKPDVPAILIPTTPQDQVALNGFKLDVGVGVVDRFNNKIPNLEVAFKVVEGGGSIDGAPARTDPDGRIHRTWTLSTVGTNSVSATVAGLEPIVFRSQVFDSADVRWYKLESWGDAPFSPGTGGILEARIGFAPMNDCDCLSAQGYFFRTLTYTDGGSWTESGPYKNEGASLISAYWRSGSADKDVVTLVAPDPWDGDFDLTWIYRLSDGG